MCAPDRSSGESSPDSRKHAADSDRKVDACSNDENKESATRGFPRWKRIFDLICVLVAAPVWLPVMILVAIWIKLVSPGPTFFRQERIGYRGRHFTILKFRSMKANVETKIHEQYVAQLIQADTPMRKLDTAGDARLIPCGRILRSLGLDELPQILNVLRGDMSLVGPRPCTPHEFQHYQPWQRERVNAPPGLTGFWQVSGKNRTTFSEMIQMDLYYAQNMSLMLDIGILLKTVPAIGAQVMESWKAKQGALNTCVTRLPTSDSAE